MKRRRSRPFSLSRRDFGILALYGVAASCVCVSGTAIAGLLGRRQGRSLSDTPTAPPSPPTPSSAPSPTATPAPPEPPPLTPTASADREVLLGLQRDYLRKVQAAITGLRDPYARIVVRPVEDSDLAINIGGDVVHDSASIIKAIILTYAVFRDPQIALGRWQSDVGQNAYRMTVSSNNTATAGVLVASVLPDDRADGLNIYNDFHQHVLGLPPDTGLTQWEYGAMGGVTTSRVIIPPVSSTTARIANPISLDALVEFFRILETPLDLDAAITRALELPDYPLRPHQYDSVEEYRAAILEAVGEAKYLLGIPDPEVSTEFEQMVGRAGQQHPDLSFSLYGKNGVISPGDWQANRWQLSEAGGVTITQDDLSASFILAYTSSTFRTEVLFDIALEYCASLFRAQFGLPG